MERSPRLCRGCVVLTALAVVAVVAAACGAEGGGTGDRDASTADARTGPVTYSATGSLGAMDRLWIRKADPARDQCVSLGLVSPGRQSGFDFDLPEPWAVDVATVHMGAQDCHEVQVVPGTAAPATSGTGAITWDAPETYPASITVDVTLRFTSGHPWVPREVELTAQNLSVAL